jgi:hypothetical protein
LLDFPGLARVREHLGYRRAELLLIHRTQTSPFATHFSASRNAASIAGHRFIKREYVTRRPAVRNS